jgi:hypothetical protein
MESANVANNYADAFEEYEQKSSLLIHEEEILQSEIRPNRFFEGLIFSFPICFLMWGIIIWVIL